jgi:DNA-binding transcriptional regulator LsrR (DeoR family)
VEASSSRTRIDTDEQNELLAEVAEMYFVQGLNQSQIAVKTGYSRSMISRLLTQAVKQKVVEFHIVHPLARCNALEQKLKHKFSLKDARVLASAGMDYAQMLAKLGKLAARVVDEQVHSGMTVGVSWGTGVAATFNALKPKPRSQVTVLQIIGSYGTPDPEVDGHELARKLARIFGGKFAILPAPLVVANETMRNALLNDPRVRQILLLARHMQLAVVGIGTVDAGLSSLVRAGCLSKGNARELAAHGAVGDVCAIHFDMQGNLVDTPFTHRIVGIDARTLQAVPTKIGVAGGIQKASAVLGALHAKFVNVLVTDEIAATEVLKLSSK